MSFFRRNREKTSESEVPTSGVIMEAENMVEGAIRRCRRSLYTVPLDATIWLVLLAIGIASMFLIKVSKWISIARH